MSAPSISIPRDMLIHLWRLLLASQALALTGCTFSSVTPSPTVAPPAVVPVTDGAGAEITSHSGPLWVLLSGVDEHGLIAEHELTLLTKPEVDAAAGAKVHTGTPVMVQEIRQTGPQNLRRFYQVQTVTGQTGWISDFYVRRQAYLYDAESETVALHASPEGMEVVQLPNVSPVAIKEPADGGWWLVQPLENDTLGWVRVEYVKESPEREFLLNQQHDH